MPAVRFDQNLHVPNKCLNSQEPKSTHEFLKPHTVIPIKLFITELRSGTARMKNYCNHVKNNADFLTLYFCSLQKQQYLFTPH